MSSNYQPPRVVNTDDPALRLQFTWKGPPDTPLPEARYPAWVAGLLLAPVIITVTWLLMSPVDLIGGSTVGKLLTGLGFAGFTGWRVTRRVDRARELRAAADEVVTAPRLWTRPAFLIGTLTTLPLYWGVVHVVSSGFVRVLTATVTGLVLTVWLVRRVGARVSPVTPLTHHLTVLTHEVTAPRPGGPTSVTVTVPGLWPPPVVKVVTVPGGLTAPTTPHHPEGITAP